MAFECTRFDKINDSIRTITQNRHGHIYKNGIGLLGAISGFIGLFFLSLFLLSVWEITLPLVNRQTGTGTITRVNSDLSFFQYKYTVDDETFLGAVYDLPSPVTFKEGQSIPISYGSYRPQSSRAEIGLNRPIDIRTYISLASLFAISAILLWIGWSFAFINFIIRSRKEKLMTTGTRVYADFVKTILVEGPRKYTMRPYKIVCRDGDRSFESEYIWFNPADLIAKAQITRFCLYHSDKHHYMPLEELLSLPETETFLKSAENYVKKIRGESA